MRSNMFNINYVSFVFLMMIIGAFAGRLPQRTCKDCILLEHCRPAALSKQRQVSSDYIKQVNTAFCGFGKGIKVCCLDFEKNEVYRHPNISLLPGNCGPINGNRIFGGIIASLYEFPWMALIAHQNGDVLDFHCAGTIINSRYILTAAHCLINKDIIGVRVGDFDINNEYDCEGTSDGHVICENHIQDIPVDDTMYHENYDGIKFSFDIGLIRLAEPIDFTHKNAAPICLPVTEKLRSAQIENKIATVAGWGLTEKKKSSTVLLKVDVPIHPDDKCSNLYSRILQPKEPKTGSRQICAGTLQKDSCKGDSGGPLILEDRYEGAPRFIQYGIVSQGPEKCGSESPAIYTAVSPYIDWILDNLRP